jgi:drug/metabolite transporter (DMT)-like permease
MNVHVHSRAVTLPRRRPGSARRATWVIAYAIPAIFVLLWASGFVVPRAFAPYAEPFSFVAARNAGAAFVLTLNALALRRPWPAAWADRLGLMWAGALLQGLFLMAGYWAIVGGLAVGVGALVGAMQPALTALFAALMVGEGLARRQWLGLVLGFASVAVVISPKLATGEEHASIILAFVFLAGVACAAYASVYQKRFEHAGDAFTRTTLIFVGATVPAVLGALLFEHGHLIVVVPLVAVYLWSVFALANRRDHGAALSHPERPGGQGRVAHLSGAADLRRDGLARL